MGVAPPRPPRTPATRRARRPPDRGAGASELTPRVARRLPDAGVGQAGSELRIVARSTTGISPVPSHQLYRYFQPGNKRKNPQYDWEFDMVETV